MIISYCIVNPSMEFLPSTNKSSNGAKSKEQRGQSDADAILTVMSFLFLFFSLFSA